MSLSIKQLARLSGKILSSKRDLPIFFSAHGVLLWPCEWIVESCTVFKLAVV